MSGSDTSNRDGVLAAEPGLVNLSVHSLPSPTAAVQEAATRTARGRLQMLLVLLACAAPVALSYFMYFVVRPQARTNYAELVLPPRPLPAALALRGLDGAPLDASTLRGQWLLVVVAGGACDARCERDLLLQRQLHQAMGREKERIDKVWIVDDAAPPRPETLAAIFAAGSGAGAHAGVSRTTVVRAEPGTLAAWLHDGAATAAPPRAQGLYVVDPRGDYMMRPPPAPDPARLKRDLDRLLRASSGWDGPGRSADAPGGGTARP